jgi:tRNA modification GTPase
MADTIYALSTTPGRSAVAIVRISGPDAHRVIALLTKRTLQCDRRMALRRLSDPETGIVLDDALVVCFPENGSYTGEATVELHLHGGRAVIKAVLRSLAAMPFLRSAEPGEFTRQAMENGRLDLSQIEGLADLIDAETEAQRRQAIRSLEGVLSAAVERWRSALLSIMATIEVSVDFADEELPETVVDEAASRLDALIADITGELAGAEVASSIPEGFEVALLGAPNVGKSTLMNRIARREVSLTSEIAGTTRDVLEIRCDLGGLPVTFLDMAGIREATDPIEIAGVRRARERAAKADLRIVMLDAPGSSHDELVRPHDIVVVNRADLLGSAEGRISALTGEGVDQVLEHVAAFLQSQCLGAGSLCRERHRNAAERAVSHLNAALGSHDIAIMSEEVRCAARDLESLIGVVDVEHILSEIFSRFCLGK